MFIQVQLQLEAALQDPGRPHRGDGRRPEWSYSSKLVPYHLFRLRIGQQSPLLAVLIRRIIEPVGHGRHCARTRRRTKQASGSNLCQLRNEAQTVRRSLILSLSDCRSTRELTSDECANHQPRIHKNLLATRCHIAYSIQPCQTRIPPRNTPEFALWKSDRNSAQPCSFTTQRHECSVPRSTTAAAHSTACLQCSGRNAPSAEKLEMPPIIVISRA